MVFICMHTAITTLHINKPITSQEHMVFICLHPAATTPHITKDKKNITGTSGNGVSLYAYSDNNATYKPKPYNITGTYGVDLYADSDNNINKPKPKITTTGTYSGVALAAYSDNNARYKPKPKITTTGTYYQGVYLEVYSKLQQTKKEKRKKHTKILQIKPITKNNKK